MSKSKPVLLVVTTTFPRWKNDTDPPFVYELSRRLTKDFDVVIHTPHYPKAAVQETLMGCRVHRFRYFFSQFEKIAGQSAILPFLRKNKGYYIILPFFLLAQFFSLVRLIHKIKPNVIHAHWLIPTGFFAILAAGKIPVVVTGHGADVFGMRLPLFQILKKLVLKRARVVTVVSDALKREVNSINKECFVNVLPMGVDGNIFKKPHEQIEKNNKKQGKIQILFVGRLSEKKGVCYLLDAMQKIVEVYPYVDLWIIGDGEECSNLRNQVLKLGLEQKVRFFGAVPNNELPKYYKQADVFVSPSIVATDGDMEGFGLTFIEASFSGCFLIGSECGGVGDIINHKKTGLLVKPKNSKDLAEKICWAIENRKENAAIQEAAMEEHRSKYDWILITKKYVQILLKCLM